ncbi:hypothetical protein HA402_002852 [Bradysia odoriphaga]|nr:hypothetical protein HA402_002852 [Bradysia odoriphaga]
MNKEPEPGFHAYYEHTFGPTCKNSDVYEVIAPMVERCKIGYNATVISYGQKSSGKTYTLFGNDNDPGVAMLAIHQLFKNSLPPFKRLFIIRAGFIEIYNETMYDLLNHRQIVQFDGTKLSNKEVVVNDKETIFKLMDKGNKARLPTSTADAPSTSHTIFKIVIENQDQALETAPVEVGCLNFVDLDRSEGAQVKNEKGNSFDKSLAYLQLAVKALSKGEKFRNYSKSKLTRLLKLGGNANTAIICHVTPTSPNQSNITLNFANEARNVRTKTVCNKVYSDDVMIRQVRADIARLQRLKDELEPLLLNSSKIECEIADLNSILLLGEDMRPQGHTKPVITNQVLKIRSFFLGVAGTKKKCQIAEMQDMSVDAQSRPQRKSNAIKWSDFYLERVGFELSLSMRRHLKYGKNIIGRSTTDSDVDICVDSLECSRKHCFIDISNDLAVTIKDLNSSNGTTVNGIKYKGRTIDLHEGDVITIVGGSHSLVGNLDCTVYRLCRFATEKMKYFDLDDGPIVVNDDDNDNDMPSYTVKIELESSEAPNIIDQPTTTLTVQSQAESIIVVDDDDGNDTSYYPVKMELELPEPSTIDDNDTPRNTVEMELGLPQSSRFVRPVPTIQNEADTIIVIDDDDGDDMSYYPVKMELELPEPSSFVESEREQLTMRPTPAIFNQADPTIVFDDDSGSGTQRNTVEMELEPPQPSRLVQIDTEKPIPTQMSGPVTTIPTSTTTGSMTSASSASTTSESMPSGSTTPGSTMTASSKLSQKHDSEFNLDSFIFDDGAFGDLNDIMAIPTIQDENVSRIQSENAKLVQQLQAYEDEKKLQAEEIMRLQAKLSAQEAENNILLFENAMTVAKLREIEKDRDILREKSLKHIGEMLESFL